jgi:hypothetical protein
MVDSVTQINHDFLVLHNSHLNGTLVVDGNVRFNQQLYVVGDTTLHSNVYVNTVVKEKNYKGPGEHMCPNDGWVIF